jgi:hypothetical protein
VRRRVAIEVVDADDLVVGTGGKIAAIGRKANGVDGSEMVAHVAELARFPVVLVVGVVYGLGRPDADVAI